MSSTNEELTKMIKGFRVSDLQSLLSYAGRNKGGKKNELQYRALDLLRINSSAIDMKIRELHFNRYNSRSHSDNQEMYGMAGMSDSMGLGSYSNRSNHQEPIGGPLMSRFMQSMNKHIVPPADHPGVIPRYPVNPDVKFKDLPFYDVLGELLKPSSLVTLPNERYQEREFRFSLTPRQVTDLQTSGDVGIQLRLCILDTSCEQEDEIPQSICLKVNDKVAPVPNTIPTNKPGAEPKRPKRPIDITAFTKRIANEPNEVFISWGSPQNKPFVIAIYLVRRQNAAVLIRRLKANGVRNPDHTTALIKEKLCQDRDADIATMSLGGSLMCPVGKIKMKLPCRALTCTHLQCFDAALYLQMNEKKPKWICPVCDKPAIFKTLAIDGLFLDITCKAPSECTEVQFHDDGSWTPVMPVKKQTEINDATLDVSPKEVRKMPELTPKPAIEIVDLDSGSDTDINEDAWPVLPPKKKVCKTLPQLSPEVVLESPENSQPSEEVTITPIDQFAPSTSKKDCSNLLPLIPDKSSLPPLPESLDIDSSDADCILGAPSILSKPGPSSYENVSPPSSPSRPAFCPPSTSTFPETVEVLRNTQNNRHFSNFDLFSIIQNQDESYNFPPTLEEEPGSPDIINID